jgi:hypothetical protein
VRIRDDEVTAEELSAIDENPFAFFLTSPEDLEDDSLEDLSAGIESSSSKSEQVREISPSAIQRSHLPLEDIEDDDGARCGFALPLSLKDFTNAHTDGRKSRQEQRMEDELAGLGITIPEFTIRRGRSSVRLTPSRSGRGQRQTRSLSARRPHSWRIPSPDIGTIKEERESDDGEDEKNMPKQEKYMIATPSPEEAKKETVKPKKRVHWAF